VPPDGTASIFLESPLLCKGRHRSNLYPPRKKGRCALLEDAIRPAASQTPHPGSTVAIDYAAGRRRSVAFRRQQYG